MRGRRVQPPRRPRRDALLPGARADCEIPSANLAGRPVLPDAAVWPRPGETATETSGHVRRGTARAGDVRVDPGRDVLPRTGRAAICQPVLRDRAGLHRNDVRRGIPPRRPREDATPDAALARCFPVNSRRRRVGCASGIGTGNVPSARTRAGAGHRAAARVKTDRLAMDDFVLNALTFDVEDYFHVTGFPWHLDPASWSRFEPRVELGT